LIVSSRVSKGNGTTRLCKTFSEKRRNDNGLKTPVQKLIPLTLSIDYEVLPVLGISDGPTCSTALADRRPT